MHEGFWQVPQKKLDTYVTSYGRTSYMLKTSSAWKYSHKTLLAQEYWKIKTQEFHRPKEKGSSYSTVVLFTSGSIPCSGYDTQDFCRASKVILRMKCSLLPLLLCLSIYAHRLLHKNTVNPCTYIYTRCVFQFSWSAAWVEMSNKFMLRRVQLQFVFVMVFSFLRYLIALFKNLFTRVT